MPSNNKGNRHRARILAFQTIYSWDITGNDLDRLLDFSWMKKEEDQEILIFARLIIAGVIENSKAIDEIIEKKLTGWTLSRINKVDLAILRTGVYSLVYQKDIPAGVTINEAVEIAKEFGTDEAFKFVNAVMDGVRKSMI